MNKVDMGRGTPALQDAIRWYADKGYLPIGDQQPNQYYKPFEGSEPWDCACVAIWQDSEGRVWAEEY